MHEMRPRAVHVVLLGGLAAGLVDIVNAMAFWYLHSDVSPGRILQSVAAGLLGEEAFAGGGATAALGLVLHLGISLAMAAVFWLAVRRFPSLLARPMAVGIAYGLVTWAVMNHLVVPLSRATPPPFIPAWFVDGVLAHVLLFGLLLAFLARWSARRV
jgi:uncharacterized membrane protein YagU involved in acid resistance